MTGHTNIRQGMEVMDVNDEKVGSVGELHVPAGVTGTQATTAGMPTSGGVKIDTGFLGLGKDLYVPFSAIREVRTDCICLNVSKDSLDRMGWDQRPSWAR